MDWEEHMRLSRHLLDIRKMNLGDSKVFRKRPSWTWTEEEGMEAHRKRMRGGNEYWEKVQGGKQLK